jgi:hypothetical protein
VAANRLPGSRTRGEDGGPRCPSRDQTGQHGWLPKDGGGQGPIALNSPSLGERVGFLLRWSNFHAGRSDGRTNGEPGRRAC